MKTFLAAALCAAMLASCSPFPDELATAKRQFEIRKLQAETEAVEAKACMESGGKMMAVNVTWSGQDCYWSAESFCTEMCRMNDNSLAGAYVKCWSTCVDKTEKFSAEKR